MQEIVDRLENGKALATADDVVPSCILISVSSRRDCTLLALDFVRILAWQQELAASTPLPELKAEMLRLQLSGVDAHSSAVAFAQQVNCVQVQMINAAAICYFYFIFSFCCMLCLFLPLFCFVAF